MMPDKTAIGRRTALAAGVLLAAVLAAEPADTLYRSAGNLEYGILGPRGRFLDKRCFVVNYCDQWRIPHWSAYYLHRDSLYGKQKRLEVYFQPDSVVPVQFRAIKADYKGSGYDRGHLAPAADFKRRRAAYKSTFLLSNMSPQRDNANRRVCSAIEDALRDTVVEAGEAWIVVGNAFLDASLHRTTAGEHDVWIGRKKQGEVQPVVAVPTHLFRTALVHSDVGRWSALAYLVPNTSDLAPGWSISDYQLSVDSLEKLTGLDFYPELDSAVQQPAEAVVPGP
jgi:endonuclease G